MSTVVKLKKSGVPGKVPQAVDLSFGEVALNYADGVLYFKNTSNNIQSINAGALGVDSAATIALIQSEIDSDFITQRVISAIPAGVDSAATLQLIDSAYIQSRIDVTYVNSLDVNAGTLDGQDGTYYLNYDNFFNKPSAADFRDSAFIASIAAQTPPDSAAILGVVDSSFVQNLVNNDYVATIVDSQYIALRIGDFAQNFGTVAVVGDLSIDATTGGDTVTFAAGAGIEITTNPGTKRVTFTNTTPTTGLDFGSIANPAGFSLDLGVI